MPDLTPDRAASLAARAGLPLAAARHTSVAAVANHIHSVMTVLRDLDFGDTPPASTFRAEEGVRHVAG